MDIGILDVLDILIVAYLMYLIYRLLRGTIAFNIFIGVVILYVIWWVVGALNMNLLSLLLGKFVSYGVLILIIIFQPEVRRFLLLLGNSTLKGRLAFLDRFIGSAVDIDKEEKEKKAEEIYDSVVYLASKKTGGLIVIGKDMNLTNIVSVGTVLDAEISKELLENIFFKNSPLHDGAVAISGGRIAAASCVLPVSQSVDLPKDLGLRHRSGVSISENMDVTVIIISEETGEISVAEKGKLIRNASETVMKEKIMKYL